MVGEVQGKKFGSEKRFAEVTSFAQREGFVR
jgi:hypothetical protein